MQQYANGIVLQNVRYADKKIISRIFTRQLGLINCHAVLSQSPKAKLKMATLQPMHLIEMELQIKQNKDIQQLHEARCYYIYKDLSTNFAKISITQFINEILLKVIKDHQVNEHLFEFVETCLKWLDEHPDHFANLHLYFLTELLKYLGIEPYNNYQTHAPFFNCREGRFIPLAEPFPLGFDEQQSRLFATILNANILTMTLNKTQRQNILDLLLAYYQFQVPNFGTIKSLDVLRTVLN